MTPIKYFYYCMEEDILSYLPTVMFRGTPCIYAHIFTFNF